VLDDDDDNDDDNDDVSPIDAFSGLTIETRQIRFSPTQSLTKLGRVMATGKERPHGRKYAYCTYVIEKITYAYVKCNWSRGRIFWYRPSLSKQ